jgi:hypothetical protein
MLAVIRISVSVLLSSILSSLSWAAYTVNVSSNTGGFIPSGGGTYDRGATATITAIPLHEGWIFSGWSGDVSSTSNPLSVSIDSNKTIVSNFIKDEGDDDMDGISNFDEIINYGSNTDDSSLPLSSAGSKSSKIVSNGGVIQWISNNPNPVVEYDPVSGAPILDSFGRAKIDRTILGYFSDTQNYNFPSDVNLTFYAESKVNHTFSYWIVDGVEDFGLVNDTGGLSILPLFPDRSITIQNSFSTLEAVYSEIPEDSADYIGSTNTPATHYTEGWFYHPSRGWMWTNREAYPYFYDATDKDWMYFQSGNDKPKFYRYKTKTWLTVE